MNPTKPKYKYGDTVKNIDGTVAGSAVFDPDTGNPLTGAGAFNPNTGDAIKNVITPDLLQGTQPIPLPKENLTNPTADKVLSIADTAVEGAKTEAGTSQENYVKALQDVMNTTDKLGTYEEQAGAKQAEKTSRDLGNQVTALVRNFSAFRQEVNNNPMITGQLRDRRISSEQTRVANTVADLQFTKSLVDQNLTDARKWAKDKIDIELRPLELEVENKKFVRDNAQKFFTDTQMKRLDSQIKQEEDKIAEERDKKKTISDLGIKVAELGGDTSQISEIINSKDLGEALGIASPILTRAGNELKEFNDSLYAYNKNTGKLTLLKGAGSSGGGGGTGVGGVGIGGGVAGGTDYAGIVNTILASDKFSAAQAASIRNAINNGEDPETVIKNNAKNIMGQTLATDLDKAETAKAQLQSIDSALKEYYANGGDTGIFKGNYEKTLNNLGKTKDPKLVGLATEIALAMQAYRLAVTGTAASVQEDARIDNVFPGITNGEVLNNARTQATIKAFDTKIDQAYKNTLGSAYESIKSKKMGKGNMTDRDFVEKTLVNKGVKYDDFINSLPAGQIPVVDNVTGEVGTIPIAEWTNNPSYTSKYTKI